MSSNQFWPDMFRAWPEGIARRGIIANKLGEAIPFKGYMIKGDTLLLERTNPDPQGTRYIMLSFDDIAMVKLVDPIRPEVFKKAGYQGQFSPA